MLQHLMHTIIPGPLYFHVLSSLLYPQCRIIQQADRCQTLTSFPVRISCLNTYRLKKHWLSVCLKGLSFWL
jgi:hypothetical protein